MRELMRNPMRVTCWPEKLACLCLVGLLTFCVTPRSAVAYSPEDPEVQSMVDRGIKYLEGLSEKELNQNAYGEPEGQPMLIAYAHFKTEGDANAPLVKIGLANAMRYVERVRRDGGRVNPKPHTKAIYEICVAIMLLADVDAKGYSGELKLLLNALLPEQKPHGGFGYVGEPHGDTSQVQYVSLALWTLDRNGFELDYERVNRMIQWILRVQDPTGYWTYKPEDPGPGRGMVSQRPQLLSVTTCLAAGSALLISADVLRQWGATDASDPKIEGLPKAIKISMIDPTEAQKREVARKKAARTPTEAMMAALGRMDAYRAQRPFKRTGAADWYYYMLYTLERYESFMDFADPGRSASTAWYDNGVTSLKELQDASGAWGVSDASFNDPPSSTAFAILFLIRSTKKAIATSSRGTVAGGFGLPSDTSKIVVSGTQIKGEPAAAAVTDLLGMLEEDDADTFDQKSIPEDLKLETDPKRRRQQLDRLDRLVRGSQSWQARRVAAKLLGKSDDLAVVPALIFALSDPDTIVRRSALDGLRFISRKFDDAGMPDKPTPQEIRQAQQSWRKWYQTIYPGYVFLDSGS